MEKSPARLLNNSCSSFPSLLMSFLCKGSLAFPAHSGPPELFGNNVSEIVAASDNRADELPPKWGWAWP